VYTIDYTYTIVLLKLGELLEYFKIRIGFQGIAILKILFSVLKYIFTEENMFAYKQNGLIECYVIE